MRTVLPTALHAQGYDLAPIEFSALASSLSSIPLPHPSHILKTSKNIPGPFPHPCPHLLALCKTGIPLPFTVAASLSGLSRILLASEDSSLNPHLEQVCLGIIALHNMDTFPVRNSSQCMTVELLMCLPFYRLILLLGWTHKERTSSVFSTKAHPKLSAAQGTNASRNRGLETGGDNARGIPYIWVLS